jgi:hypothetical protein
VDVLDLRDLEWRRRHDDDRKTRIWRTERLVALGYELRDAVFLALSEVDIHELERLIEKGCPLATAVRIAS